MSRFYGFRWCFVLVVFLLAGCGDGLAAVPTVTPTPVGGIVDAGVDLIRQDMYLRLTQQSIENDRIEAGARMTETQQVMDATATQEQRNKDAQATAQSAQATQQAWQVTVQAGQAFDAATAQAAREQATATAVVQAAATQAAVMAMTQKAESHATEIARQETQQAPVMYAQQTAVFAQARKTEIELAKAETTMWVSAWGGWLFALVVMGLAGFVIWKKSQIGVIPTDQNGKPQMVVINQGGQKFLVSPGLMPAPMLTVSRDGASMPMLVDQAFQEKTTHGAQVIEAIGSLPPGYNRQAMGLAGGLSAPTGNGSVNIQVVQPGQLENIRHELDAKLIEEDE